MDATFLFNVVVSVILTICGFMLVANGNAIGVVLWFCVILRWIVVAFRNHNR